MTMAAAVAQEAGKMIDEKKLLECLAHDMSCFETEDKKLAQLYVRVDDMVRMIKGQPRIGEWIPCSDQMPETEKEVEITYFRTTHQKTYYRTARAFYENGYITEDASAYTWDAGEEWAYDEETDSCFIPEGWYEMALFTEESGFIYRPVIAWRPLPEPYRFPDDTGGTDEGNI